jgi:hypothetical protein
MPAPATMQCRESPKAVLQLRGRQMDCLYWAAASTPETDARKAFISEETKLANARTLGLCRMSLCIRR